MKRKLLYVATFATGMLLTACSNDDNLLDGAKENGLGAIFNEQGNAFFSVNINRPDVAASTRAGEDDPGKDGPGKNDRNFNDGVANEYNIENATLLLFGQKDGMTSERDYELISYYNLTPEDWTMDGSAQITQKRTSIVKVSKTHTTGYNGLWALVLANKMNYVTIEGEEDEPVLKYRNSASKDAVYQEVVKAGEKLTYGEIADLQITERHRNYNTSAFFMSNMPYTEATANGTDALAVKTLYKVNTDALYTSKETAQNNDAAVTINIERSLAKIEVVESNDFNHTTEVEHLTADVKGWFVDNTNPTTSLMRKCYEGTAELPLYAYLNYKTNNTDPLKYPTFASWSNYRFVSANYVSPGCYRTFWAVDHNYNTPATNLITKKNTVADTQLMQFDVEGNVLSGSLRAMGSYYYCTENTFDVEHQTENNTTRVVVAATFNDGKDFYTVSTKEGVIYKEVEASESTDAMTAEEHLKDYIKDEVVKRSINQAWAEFYLNDPTKLKECLDVTFSYENAAEGSKSSPKAGKLTAAISVKEAALTGKTKGTHTAADAVSKWPSDNNSALNGTSYVYNFYEKGASFYSIKIKHFGDTETPWLGLVGMDNTVQSNYGVPETSASQNYLGRYGVVRNSWYNITVTGIRQIGSPTVPDTPNIPDDTVEQYLKYTINVTPWRLYKQSEKLQ